MDAGKEPHRPTFYSTLVSYALSPILVTFFGLVIERIQRLVIAKDHGAYSNPNSIIFLMPTAILTMLGGRGPGIATLALSCSACLLILLHTHRAIGIEFYSGLANLTFMGLSGGVLIFGLDSLRKSLAMQRHEAERAQWTSAKFQERLLPHIPELLGGLAIAHYYEPALDEASVGGDFVDLFVTAQNEIVLVLGDVSGKGIAAAVQTSAVRNMLRFALYNVDTQSIASRLGEMNDAICSQSLLSGFATLFVGIYDPKSNILRYVSCGHEPAFLRHRENKEIEELSPTGTVMGAFTGSRYAVGELQLRSGDSLLVYSDGFSESGPDHKHLLGSAGVKRFFASSMSDSPECDVDTIVRSVKTFAHGQLNDDACLLICSVMN